MTLYSRSSRWQRLALPGIYLLEFIIGGAYISGSEIIEFSAIYGARGWISVVVILGGFMLVTPVIFEYARIHQTRSYRAFVDRLLGVFATVFDVIFLITAVYLLAVVTSVAGKAITTMVCAMVGECLSIPLVELRVLAVLPVIGAVLYISANDDRVTVNGRNLVDAVLSYGGYAILIVLTGFSLTVIVGRFDEIVTVFATGTTARVEGSASNWTIAKMGLIYVGIHLPAYPLIISGLFEDDSQQSIHTSGKESLFSGLLAGFLMAFPYTLTYFVLLGYYSNEALMASEIPWLPVVDQLGGTIATAIYIMVIAIGFTGTTIGLTRTVTRRMTEVTASLTIGGFADRDGLSTREQVGIISAIAAVAVFISQYGVRNLITIGYEPFAIIYAVLFGLPLFVFGLTDIWTYHRSSDSITTKQ